MDYYTKILILQILSKFIFITEAAETRDVTYCELFTHVYVNVSDPSGNILVTRTEQDEDTYFSDNLYCAWGLHAGPGKRTHVKVIQSDLGDVPDGADCYDHTYVAIKQDDIQDSYNWLEADPGMYFRVCGSLVPPEFSSQDSEVIVEFSSDINLDQHTGVEFMVTEFDADTCPPGWSEMGDMCYKIFTNTETWNVAQEFCTLLQSNLASVDSAQEADNLQDMIASSENLAPDDWVWLGQVYPEGADREEWIDGKDSNYSITAKWPEADPDRVESTGMHRCSAVTADGMWTFQPCHSSNQKYAYICKANKGGGTVLFAASYEDSDGSTTTVVTSGNCCTCIHLCSLLILIVISVTGSLC